MGKFRLLSNNRLLGITLILFLLTPGALFSAGIQSPEEFLGYRVGSDFKLAPWDSIVVYFRQLSQASDRINVRELGKTTLGKPMLVAEISDAGTVANLAVHRANQRKIADPRLITDSREEERLIRESKPVVLLNCQIHSTEAAASQMSMELAYDLATGNSPEVREILDRIIILLIPCANPDGQQMVAKYYKSTLGTPWEGGRMPRLYHKYSGHDNNRDWFMLNLKETRLETKLIYQEWFPTVLWDIHQTRKNSYRLFLPPFHDPRNPNVHPIMEQMLYVVGGQMAQALTAQGMKGVIHQVSYDNYWAGGFRTTPQRHNILGLLSEAASVNIASPIFLRRSNLRGGGRGITSYKMSVNFPDPWQGGWWRLRNIVEYEKTAAMALFTYAARFHDLLQKNYIQMGRDAIEKGKNEPPFAWLVPPGQRDSGTTYRMLERLHATGIEVHQAEETFIADGIPYPKDTFILYCAQPYRPYLMDMMEIQHYPDRSRYPGGPAEPPYDIAGWTFPLLMNVRSVAVTQPFRCADHLLSEIPFPAGKISGSGKTYLIKPGQNDNYCLLNRLFKSGIKVQIYTGKTTVNSRGMSIVPGTFTIEAKRSGLEKKMAGLSVQLTATGSLSASVKKALQPLRAPRIGLYQPWTASMDEGWTRYVLDRFEYDYTTLHNAGIRAGNLQERFDCIILPSLGSQTILKGNPPESTFPQYVGGIGTPGVTSLQEFVAAGGTLVCNDASANFAIDYFHLPLQNVVKDKKSDEFYCPGSILRLSVDPAQPLGYGLPNRLPGYFTRSQAFGLISPEKTAQDGQAEKKVKASTLVSGVEVVARYTETGLLQSGWIRGGELIAGKPAVIDVKYGGGHIILFGIRVQHRAQPQGTFPLLFNAIHRSVLVN